MKKLSVILSLFFIGLILSCAKGPGAGGRASLQGKVFAKNYDKDFLLIDSGYIGGVKVNIKYGDETGVSDDVETDYTGTYLFPFLRTGEYTIFVYSKRLTNNTIDTVEIRKVTITDKKGVTNVPQININTLKN